MCVAASKEAKAKMSALLHHLFRVSAQPSSFSLSTEACQTCLSAKEENMTAECLVARPSGLYSIVFFPHPRQTQPSFCLLYFPDGDFAITFSRATEYIAVLSRAQSLNAVRVSLQLLLHTAALRVQHQNPPTYVAQSRTTAMTAHPDLQKIDRVHCNAHWGASLPKILCTDKLVILNS